LSRAVRWGNDGVGLQFVLDEEGSPGKAKGTKLEGVDKKELERFLQDLLKGKS
jgi:hypothetical protein